MEQAAGCRVEVQIWGLYHSGSNANSGNARWQYIRHRRRGRHTKSEPCRARTETGAGHNLLADNLPGKKKPEKQPISLPDRQSVSRATQPSSCASCETGIHQHIVAASIPWRCTLRECSGHTSIQLRRRTQARFAIVAGIRVSLCLERCAAAVGRTWASSTILPGPGSAILPLV